MTNTSQSKNMGMWRLITCVTPTLILSIIANMVKVPYITASDLIRLDKAVRTIQMRFLIKRRQRLVKNVNNAQRRLSNSATQPNRLPRQGSMENNSGAYARNNANGHDASVNDTTFDEVSFNESSVASNDLSMEHNEKVRKPKGRSLMRKIGGLFASSEKVWSIFT